MEGACVAIVLRPNALKLIILADEDRLHHGGLIRVAFIHVGDAGERRAAQVHDEFLKRRAAMSRHGAQGASGAGSRPIDVALREVMGVVECAGVAVVVGLADFGVELDVLSVMQLRKRFAGASEESHLGARPGLDFEHETLASAGNRGRFDHASAEYDDLARFGIDLGWRAGGVDHGVPDAGEEKPKTAAGAGQNARAAQDGNGGEGDESGGE